MTERTKTQRERAVEAMLRLMPEGAASALGELEAVVDQLGTAGDDGTLSDAETVDARYVVKEGQRLRGALGSLRRTMLAGKELPPEAFPELDRDQVLAVLGHWLAGAEQGYAFDRPLPERIAQVARSAIRAIKEAPVLRTVGDEPRCEVCEGPAPDDDPGRVYDSEECIYACGACAKKLDQGEGSEEWRGYWKGRAARVNEPTEEDRKAEAEAWAKANAGPDVFGCSWGLARGNWCGQHAAFVAVRRSQDPNAPGWGAGYRCEAHAFAGGPDAVYRTADLDAALRWAKGEESVPAGVPLVHRPADAEAGPIDLDEKQLAARQAEAHDLAILKQPGLAKRIAGDVFKAQRQNLDDIRLLDRLHEQRDAGDALAAAGVMAHEFVTFFLEPKPGHFPALLQALRADATMLLDEATRARARELAVKLDVLPGDWRSSVDP